MLNLSTLFSLTLCILLWFSIEDLIFHKISNFRILIALTFQTIITIVMYPPIDYQQIFVAWWIIFLPFCLLVLSFHYRQIGGGDLKLIFLYLTSLPVYECNSIFSDLKKEGIMDCVQFFIFFISSLLILGPIMNFRSRSQNKEKSIRPIAPCIFFAALISYLI
jgi:hypothetical protein